MITRREEEADRGAVGPGEAGDAPERAGTAARVVVTLRSRERERASWGGSGALSVGRSGDDEVIS